MAIYKTVRRDLAIDCFTGLYSLAGSDIELNLVKSGVVSMYPLEGVEKSYILSGISKDFPLEALQKQYINAEKVVSYPLNNSVKSYPLG